jgi:hypothetical protein
MDIDGLILSSKSSWYHIRLPVHLPCQVAKKVAVQDAENSVFVVMTALGKPF